MKRLLSFAVTIVLVLAPVSAEAKSRPSKTCTSVVTVEHKAGKKIVDKRSSCTAKMRPLSTTGTWSSPNRIDWD